MFNDIVWKNDLAAPTSAPGNKTAAAMTAKADTSSSTKQPSGDVMQAAKKLTAARENFESDSNKLGLPLKVGSNALLIGPKKTASGNALLMSGPQVDFSAPGFLYEVGLHGPGINIEGSGFIGYPFIMFGANDNFALTATAGYGDVVDIFTEKLNPQNPHQYEFQGKWVDMKKKVETFEVRAEDGTTRKETKEFYSTVHGPVIFFDEQNNTAYNKAWTFRGTEAQSWSAYVQANWAKNIKEFEDAAHKFTMSLNWFYADKTGNIGYYHVGKYPIRDARVDLRLPTPGTGEYEWKGFQDTANNPHVVNPEAGFVANWNNKPTPEWQNNEQSFRWGGDHRVLQYISQIQNRDQIKVEDLNDFNYYSSMVNLKTTQFKPYLLKALQNNLDKDPRFQAAYDYLSKWNNLNLDENEDGNYDSVGQTIFEAWWSTFTENVFKPTLGDAYASAGSMVSLYTSTGLLLRVLQGDEAVLPVEYDWLQGVDKEQFLLTSLTKALDKLEKEKKDMNSWLTPIRTISFGGETFLGMPHGLGTPKKILDMNRGSENHYLELTKQGPTGVAITPPGQVGFVKKDGSMSSHYDDQIEMFANWEYKPFLFTEEKVNEQAVSTEFLEVGDEGATTAAPLTPAASTSDSSSPATLNGKPVPFAVISVKDDVLLPVRSFFQEAGYTVSWQPEQRVALIENGKNTIIIPLTGSDATVNKQPYTLPKNALIKEGRIYLSYTTLVDMIGGKSNKNQGTLELVTR
ncbi:penicillin acylase family protein [Brevibacillus sp. SIMBA_040]|uniref:penicillin acylase family protein n=1 Tax=unclassified Brevibacillus TaxID=2684853 RepID=UPI003979233F